MSFNSTFDKSDTSKEKFLKLLILCGYGLGPASLVNYLGQVFLPAQFAAQYLASLAIAAFVITFILLLNLPWKEIVRFLPQTMYLVLTLILLLPFLQDANLWKVSAPVTWSRNLVKHLPKNCPPESNSYLSDPCIIQQLASFNLNSPPKLVDDLRIGETLLYEKRIADVLDRCFGVKNDFSGTGLSLPDFANGEYSLARIPEYWIPNQPESSELVWTWVLDPQSADMKMPLRVVLEKNKPLIKHRSTTFKAELEKNASQLLPTSKAPVLIRFGQFPKKIYSNHIGRDNAKLVFASHFGELERLGLNVWDAASYSGRAIRNSDPADLVFVWVIFPKSNPEVIPATWHTLLTFIAKESGDEKQSTNCK
jgi:hypothetical protein